MGMPTSDPHAIQRDIARSLALHLRDLRERSGLTQEQAAERAGMATNTYQRFERGISKKDKPVNPRLSTLISLAGAFGTDLGQLLVVEYDSSVTDTAELPGATYPEELPPARP
ncbi:hypothetical protein Pcatena_13560 [Parolsenella catena]|uniref:HTH cro/C1-type domain-containing protein n=2 Tax=Parolsenella catena TaxID=2003188 RepID=A0A3G9K8U2_9ACTN|nr:hypothetical protein Pcatena_13560 [Parolsenella catena]